MTALSEHERKGMLAFIEMVNLVRGQLSPIVVDAFDKCTAKYLLTGRIDRLPSTIKLKVEIRSSGKARIVTDEVGNHTPWEYSLKLTVRHTEQKEEARCTIGFSGLWLSAVSADIGLNVRLL